MRHPGLCSLRTPSHNVQAVAVARAVVEELVGVAAQEVKAAPVAAREPAAKAERGVRAGLAEEREAEREPLAAGRAR